LNVIQTALNPDLIYQKGGIKTIGDL